MLFILFNRCYQYSRATCGKMDTHLCEVKTQCWKKLHIIVLQQGTNAIKASLLPSLYTTFCNCFIIPPPPLTHYMACCHYSMIRSPPLSTRLPLYVVLIGVVLPKKRLNKFDHYAALPQRTHYYAAVFFLMRRHCIRIGTTFTWDHQLCP